VLAVLAKLAAVGLRAERTRLLLRREVTVGRLAFASIVFSRFAADNLLAGWTGLGLQAWLLTRRAGPRASSVIGALALEKYVDAWVVAAAFAWAMHGHLLSAPVAENAMLVALGMSGAVLIAALLCLRLAPDTRVARVLEPAMRPLATISDGAGLALTTVGVWVFECLLVVLSMRAAGIRLDFAHALFLTVAYILAFVVPGVPSGIGTVEAAMVAGLVAIGVGDARALGATLLFHAVVVVPETALGLLSLRSLGIGLRRTRLLARRASLHATHSPAS
jgi:uncharacterized membrane protein YbhN (UPF0104 family)